MLHCLFCVCLFWQIVKVLTLYTPVIEFEERVSNTFITTIKVSSWTRKLCSFYALFLWLASFLQYLFVCIVEPFEGKSRVVYFDDGCQEDLLCQPPLHTLLCGSGHHSDPC